MVIKPKFRPSLEAVAYQGKSGLLHELSLVLDAFIKGRKYTKTEFDSLNLTGIVQRYTGLNIEFELEQTPLTADAYAIPIMFDVNNPLLAHVKHFGHAHVLGEWVTDHKKILTYTRELRGMIDRKNSRVTGLFSKIPTKIVLSTGLWQRANLSPEEVAAVTLHEIGHVFTFIETLVFTATSNMALASATQALRECDDQQIRLQLVHETAQHLNVTIDDPASLAQPGVKGEVFQAVFLKAMADPKSFSVNGSDIYDLRSSEFLADQFATRHGAGRHLVIGLDKMLRKDDPDYRQSRASFFFAEAVKIAGMIVVSVGCPPIAVLMVLVTTLGLALPWRESKIYDDPGERLARIKQDLVQILKSPKLSPEEKKQVLVDIEIIDELRADVRDHRGLFDYLWLALSGRRRDQYKQMRIQQDIERMVNNDLFVSASKLQTSSTTEG